MAQPVKNLPAVRETWVLSLDWEDPLERGISTHSSILAWRNSMDCIVHGVAESQTWLSDFHFHFKEVLCLLQQVKQYKKERLNK